MFEPPSTFRGTRHLFQLVSLYRRRLLTTCVIALSLLVVAVGGLAVYVFPTVDFPARTDVIFVIGPPTPSRLEIANALIREGMSENLMISVPGAGPSGAAHLEECHQPHVFCETPSPFTTQGEARWLKSLAGQEGWESATVITFTPHVSRARLIMQRCFSGELRMVADHSSMSFGEWIYQFAYQTGAYAKAELNPQC